MFKWLLLLDVCLALLGMCFLFFAREIADEKRLRNTVGITGAIVSCISIVMLTGIFFLAVHHQVKTGVAGIVTRFTTPDTQTVK